MAADAPNKLSYQKTLLYESSIFMHLQLRCAPRGKELGACWDVGWGWEFNVLSIECPSMTSSTPRKQSFTLRLAVFEGELVWPYDQCQIVDPMLFPVWGVRLAIMVEMVPSQMSSQQLYSTCSVLTVGISCTVWPQYGRRTYGGERESARNILHCSIIGLKS